MVILCPSVKKGWYLSLLQALVEINELLLWECEVLTVILKKFQVLLGMMLCRLTLILRRSRTGTVWFYTSTSNKRAARPKLYTKSLTRDLKLMYSRLTLVRISIKL